MGTRVHVILVASTRSECVRSCRVQWLNIPGRLPSDETLSVLG